jgi:hypothetical protein
MPIISPVITAPVAWPAGSWVVSRTEAVWPCIEPIVVGAPLPGITHLVGRAAFHTKRMRRTCVRTPKVASESGWAAMKALESGSR